MNAPMPIHDRAMDLAYFGRQARGMGDVAKADRLLAEALKCELEAIALLEQADDLTFSVLHRSAAWLAIECDNTRLAEKLASTALAQDPPPPIDDELREVWERANFDRHLELRGVTLNNNELQMSLSGPAVGPGITQWAPYRSRVDKSLAMLTRIAERQTNVPFRHGGRPAKKIRDLISAHVSLPRAASYAVTIGLGDQMDLSLGFDAKAVIGEFMNIVENVEQGQEDKLDELIPDELYRRNALELAKQIAPDGTHIRQVGFSTPGREGVRKVGLTRRGVDVAISRGTDAEKKKVRFRGILLHADALQVGKNVITIVEEDGTRDRVVVPPEMMDDIVRPLWNAEVEVRAMEKGRSLTLLEIDAEE